ncbi:hypothetical protein AgCh_019586 [Apium graveolens]
MQSFKDCVVQVGLRHVHTVGDLFTWYNKRPNEPMQIKKFGKPFQFFNYMLELPNFLSTVQSAWQVVLFGNPMVVLARKIKLTKNALRELNKNHGDINNNVTSARASLRVVQDKLVLHKDCDLLAFEKSLSDKLAQCLLQQEHKGDENNSFFFNQYKKNWNSSKVLALEDSMGLVHGQAHCATVSVKYFTEFLGKASPCVDANLSSIQCPTITEAQSSLPSLIDVAQSAFIPGRVISDNVLLAQELFRGYDRVTEKMGFNATFIFWIKACICTPKFSVKLNGIVHGYFAGAQGIRQGNINQKGGAKIAWTTVCLPKEEGGLGVKNMIDWNRAQILGHLLKIITKHNSLWSNWVHATLLRNKHLWIMHIPTDSSWIWKKILKSCTTALQFITYVIGNGCSTSLWFDPWWEGICLASTLYSPIIRQCRLTSNAMVSVLLHSGVDVTKVTNWDIWNSLRNKEHEVSWAPAVWSKLVIYRYAHHQWVACHGRLPTLARLARFGITSTQLCYLCIGGTETDNHILRHCPYSAWVLGMIYHVLKVHIFCDSWLHCLELALQISDRPLRALSLYCLQIVCYHIWRERKSRAHDKECFGPQQLFDGIMVDFKARLSGSLKFTKIVCSRSDLIF